MDSIIMRQPDSGRMTHAMRTDVASRSAGQAMARKRGAAWRRFTPQLRDVEQVCAVLRRTARQGPAGRAATETLAELLRLLPRRSWAGLPVLRVTNQHLASRLSCCIRQVQRHLARLHQLGIIAIDWSRANSRLRFDRHDDQGEERQVGIDLRPAIVFAHEQHELGSVEIHRELMTAAARWMMAVKLVSVLSARIAMRLNSLSLQKKFSIR